MRFTIVGAGAIGGITGAHLARAGHEVTLVDTVAEHVAAIRDGGITLEGRSDLTMRVASAIGPGELKGPLGTVICAVKALHTKAALAAVEPLLGRDEYVLSMQNGLSFEDVAAVVGRERTLAACFNFGGYYKSPGRVVHSTTGGFHVGEIDGRISTRARELRDALAAVQECDVTDNVIGCIWSKMAMASTFFATALVDADCADILARERYHGVMADLVAETVAAAEANGVSLIDLNGFDPRDLRFGRSPAQLAGAMDVLRGYWLGGLQGRTGIWRDLAVRKRKTEAEPQLGGIIAAGKRAGVAMPLNEAVYRMIAEIETGRRGFRWENLDEIEELVAG
jgi:2-dehydropantoate 2-reductase